MRLCASDEAFVNWIATLPAFALSDVLVNFSWPLGSAAIVRAPAVFFADVDGVLVVEVGGGLDAADDLVLVPLDPPHALRLSSSVVATVANAVVFAMVRYFRVEGLAEIGVIADMPRWAVCAAARTLPRGPWSSWAWNNDK